MKQDLTIEIPAKYRAELEARFDPRNAEDDGDHRCIDVRCPLCRDFFIDGYCYGCPFFKFQGRPAFYTPWQSPCVRWIKKVAGVRKSTLAATRAVVSWKKADDRLARRQLKRLRERAEKLIKWI